MGLPGVITASVFLILHAVGLFRLIGNLSDYASLEMIAILVGLVLSVCSLLGILFNKRWGWPLMLVAFSLGLANAVFLYSQIGGSITLALLFAVTVFAMVLSFFAVDLWEPQWREPQWAADHVAQDVPPVASAPQVKKSVKKASRKSVKKSAGRSVKKRSKKR